MKCLAHDAFDSLGLLAGLVQDVTDEEQKGLAHDTFDSLAMSCSGCH